MTRRAVVLGLGLGAAISLFTYFNNWIVGQTQLIGNFLPVAVFGLVCVTVLAVNPLLSRAWPRALLRPSELCAAAAIALAACGWPASNFYRYLVPVTALPAHWIKSIPGWQAQNVMSYVPGASAELGEGHLTDPEALLRDITAAATSDVPSPARQIWFALDPDDRRALLELAREPHLRLPQKRDLLRRLNRALGDPSLYDRAVFAQLAPSRQLAELLAATELAPAQLTLRNRLLLAESFPEAVLPPPSGSGLLPNGGRSDPLVVDTLLSGRSSQNQLPLARLPWGAWWPTLALWGGLSLLLGFCALCLALVVHPQWSRRELLSYPIVRFVRELARRRAGARFPRVATSNPFWLGFAAVAFWHAINGLHAWFPEVPEIPRTLDFKELVPLFPNAARSSYGRDWFSPMLYPSVIAFAYFMTSSVAFSLGVGHVLFLIFASIALQYGVGLSTQDASATPSSMLRFGAYLGATAVILYTGRRYYRDVLLSALGGARDASVPVGSMWALRALWLCAGASVLAFTSAGLGLSLAVLYVLICLMVFLVVTRIVAETGSFFVQVDWSVAVVLTSLLGFGAVGPSAFVIMALASHVIIPDFRETLMPYLSNGLQLVDGAPRASLLRVTKWMLVMIVLGFVLAGAVTFYLQYNFSVLQAGDEWATHWKPRVPFDELTRWLSRTSVDGTLVQATAAPTGLSPSGIVPAKGTLGWGGLGLLLYLGASAARLRLPWWPLHPVAFLTWDTYALVRFGPSLLLGWLFKVAVVGAGGARGYHAVRPAIIGVIAAELCMALFWIVVGLVYYFATGQRPASYAIFPP